MHKVALDGSSSLPLLEVRVDHPVGEALTADTDAFKYTVASELMHDKVRVDDACIRTTDA